MTIALFDTNTALGGAQRALLDVARGLRSRKQEVLAILGMEGPLHEAFHQLGIPTIIEPIPQWARQVETPHLMRLGWRTVLRLVKHFRRHGARLVYANTPAAAFLGGLAMRLACGRTIWRVYLNTELQNSPALANLSYRCATRVHAATTGTLDTLRSLLGDARRGIVVAPGIDLVQHPTCANRVRKRGELPTVGMLGAWMPREGQEVLVKAVRLLQEGGRRARVRVIGHAGSIEQERYRSVVLGAVRAAGLADRLTVEEMIEEPWELMASCEVLVIPSLHESTGRLALEAAAMGRPVVASRVNGLQEIIEDGHTGLLVPPNHPRALADALELLLASPALRSEIGRLARVRAEEHFRLNGVLDAIEGAMVERGMKVAV